MRNFRLHPAHQLIMWCFFALLLLELPPFFLLGVGVSSVLITAILIPGHIFKTSLWRLRWLIGVTGVIFSWGTPGVYWFNSEYAPTIEGLYLAGEQVVRLVTIVTSLQLVLWHIGQKYLLSACYYLIYPLKWCGIDITSFAIRLGLTLHYVTSESAYPKNLKWEGLLAYLHQLEQKQGGALYEVEIVEFTVFDRWVCVGLLSLGFAGIVGVKLLL